MRVSRLVAVARQDLRVELKGRGLLLPIVIAGLLLPASTLPSPLQRLARPYSEPVIAVSGVVPPGVRELASVRATAQATAHFEPSGGVMRVHTPVVPTDLRALLDGPRPAVVVHHVPQTLRFPGRTMLLALVTASTLTGAVAASIGGERSRRTLGILLAAAITRGEIVVGKWLAWGVLGSLSGLGGAATAIVSGNVQPGWWLVPLAMVPLATVAVGLWLVREAGDVVAGTSTSLRVLPAAFSILGVIAWLLGNSWPLIGAAVPLGGALVAAGDAWEGPWPALVATLSTGALAAGCLAATVRDLEEVPSREPPDRSTRVAVVAGLLALGCWWAPIGMPLLWAEAGNAAVGSTLPARSAAATGATLLLAMTAIRLAREVRPLTALGVLGLGARSAWLGTVPLAALLAALPWLPTLHLTGRTGAFAELLAAPSDPHLVGWAPAIAMIVADELLFRGWLTRTAGPLRAGLVWCVVRTPFDPAGAIAGLALGGLAARAGPLPGLVARLLALIALV